MPYDEDITKIKTVTFPQT